MQSKTKREREIRAVLSRVDRGTETLAAAAGRAGVRPSTLKWWRSELRRRDRRGAGKAFVEVKRSAPTMSSAPFELTLPTGSTLRIGPGFDGRELEQLLRIVRESC